MPTPHGRCAASPVAARKEVAGPAIDAAAAIAIGRVQNGAGWLEAAAKLHRPFTQRKSTGKIDK